jgi:flagellar hook-associated protein 1 FlgK
MAGSALMSIGLRAMQAQYAALQTTGHNISNANTVGYSRQQVELATAGGQFTGAGFFGKGVDVQTVTRAHSDFLTREVVATRSTASADEARDTQLAMLERVFGLGEAGLGYTASRFFNAFADVAARPSDLPSRQVALARAQELGARFRTAAEQIDSIQAGVTTEIDADLATANELAKTIAKLNDLIAKSQGTNQAPNDLLDQRDKAVAELAQIVQVTTIAADDGSLSVFIGGGQRLVLGGDAGRLVAMPDPFDSARTGIGIALGTGAPVAMPESLFTGGRIAGLLRVQNDDLVAARNLLGQMAAAIAGTVNAQQALGLDLRGSTGSPIFTATLPDVLASSNNTGGATVSATIADPTALLASDYELFADPALAPGNYRLTRLSDGTSSIVTDGTTVDGFTLTIGPPAPAARDRFQIRPVGGAARNLAVVLDDPRGLAAASPVVATAGTSNTGTATVAGVRAASPSLNPNLTATISFTNGSGAYSWTLVDTTGTLPTTSGTGTWSAGSPIALNGFELSLNGVPASGDSFSVARTAFAGADNGNANALLALGSARIVGIRPGSSGASVTDAYANVLADVGVRVQGASLAADQSAAMAADAQAAQAARTGVNLDEEAARLIQFQQSYQAAAKVLQVAQTLFDSVLQAAAR